MAANNFFQFGLLVLKFSWDRNCVKIWESHIGVSGIWVGHDINSWERPTNVIFNSGEMKFVTANDNKTTTSTGRSRQLLQVFGFWRAHFAPVSSVLCSASIRALELGWWSSVLVRRLGTGVEAAASESSATPASTVERPIWAAAPWVLEVGSESTTRHQQPVPKSIDSID